MNKLRTFLVKPGVISALAAILSAAIGILFGLLMLFVFDSSNAVSGFFRMTTASFASLNEFARTLYQASPLILTGLSVGFAFKTGLFNIGAPGQYTVGAFFALMAGIVYKQPWWVCMFCAMLGGALWGLWPGLFKALFNVNEVITSIMFNWIGLFTVNLFMSNTPEILWNHYGGPVANRTPPLALANAAAVIPKQGLDVLFGGSRYINISIFIAIACAIVVHVVLNKTTFGYELRACGYNRDASTYAGVSATRCIILSMVIAGALAGIAGGIYFLSGNAEYVIDKNLNSMGFNGIPVALLASSHPIGTVFSAMFVSYIQVGGDALQPEYIPETIEIIIAVIIYLAAFALLMRDILAKFFKPREPVPVDGGSENTEEEDGAAGEPGGSDGATGEGGSSVYGEPGGAADEPDDSVERPDKDGGG